MKNSFCNREELSEKMLPISYVVVKGEKKASSSQFLKLLIEVLGGTTKCA